MKRFLKVAVFVFLILNALVEFYSEWIGFDTLTTITKPLLLPSLMAYFALSVNGVWKHHHKLLCAALIFSWIGDVSLMLTPDSNTDFSLIGIAPSKYYFLLGLSSFLVNHLFLMRVYRTSVHSTTPTFFQQSKIYFLPFLVFYVVMIAVIIPPLLSNDEKSLAAAPVVVYAGVITTMATFALNRYGKVNNRSFWMVWIGALLFVFSDSVIALNFLAFPGVIPNAGFVIITTYFAAELLIVQGVLEE